MDVGVYTFATDRDIDPGEFARAVEDRGFAALMLTEHSHIPAGRDTRTRPRTAVVCCRTSTGVRTTRSSG
jgi:alkanesulfonate monooxygenase SsuD/methylene tetrahydromethanopterin reductase-like flavin-dependent oxidoreductase (luciferase family)